MCRASFMRVLEQRREEDVHQWLARHHSVMVRAFFWNGTYLCLSKFRFGTVFVSDFLLVKLWSTITDIVLVELEPPHKRPFNRDGRYSQRLNGAMQQVTQWSAWIRENRQFFHDSVLREASSVNPSCVASLTRRIRYDMLYSKIVIGRRQMMNDADNSRRASLYLDSRGGIEIVPYDRLLDAVHEE